MKIGPGTIMRQDAMSRAIVARYLAAILAVIAALAIPARALADDAMRNEFYRSLAQGRANGSVESRALLVSGVIGPGSYDEFRAAVARVTPEMVVLDGPGGIPARRCSSARRCAAAI
jgi:hypothetical protein